jgi:hypothetical protein
MGILEIFYQPGKLFSSLETRRAAWVAPLILGTLLIVVTQVVVVRRIGMETIIRQQLEGTRLSPEQLQAVMTAASTPAAAYRTYAGGLLIGPIALLFIAGLLTLFALVGSKQPKFSTNFSMVSLAFFPYRLVVCLMTVLVLMTAPDPTVLDSGNLLATNVGAFMNKETMSKGLYTFLGALDVLSFVEIGLLSYGFAKVNRTSIAFGLFAVLSLWFVYVMIRVGFSFLF